MPDTSRTRTLDALRFVDVHLDAHMHILVDSSMHAARALAYT